MVDGEYMVRLLGKGKFLKETVVGICTKRRVPFLIGKDCSLVIGVIGVPPPSLPVTVLENKRNWFIHSSVTVAVYCKVNCVLASVKLSAGSEL